MPTAYASPVSGPPQNGVAPTGDTLTAPPVVAPRRIAPDKLAGLFGSPDSFIATIPEDRRADFTSRLQSVPNSSAARQRLAITVFLADRLNLSAPEVAARYDTLRNSYAKQMFGERMGPDGTMDDGVFFTNVSRLLADEKTERQAQAKLDRVLFAAATEGKDFNAAMEAARATGEVPSGRRADLFNAWLAHRWETNRASAAKLAPVVDSLAEVMANNRDPGRAAAPDLAGERWDEMIGALEPLDDQERATVLALAAERAKATAQAGSDLGAKVAASFIEGTSDLVGAAITGLYNTVEATVGHTAAEERRHRRYQIEREVSRVLSGEVDPITSDSYAGQVALEFTRSVPTMLAALTPTGLALDYFALKQQARERLEGEGAKGPAAEWTAAVQAIPQTALFFASSRLVFLGQAPKFVMPADWTLRGLAGSVATTAGVEFVANAALNEAGLLSDVGVQAVASKLSEAVPDVDWEAFGRNYVGSAPDRLAFAIPGALIGTGVASFRNIKQGQRYLAQLATAEEMGFTPEAVEAIAAAPDYATAEKAFRDGWETREPDTLTEAEAEAMAARERDRMLSAPDDSLPFEALEEVHPDDQVINPDAPDVPPGAEPQPPELRLKSELAYVLKEITENEAELGRVTGQRGRRRKAYEQKLQSWLRRDYLRRLELQADLDVPGARDALAKYLQDVEKAAVPTRARLVWDYVTTRKLPPLSALGQSLRGEIADLEIPRKFFDPAKTHGLDVMGQSLVDWLAEHGDADAAAMIERGEQFSETEVAAMVGDAFSDFRAREERAARGLDEVPVPVIPMPDDVAGGLPAVKEVPAAPPPFVGTVEPLGRRFLVAEGVGEPVAQYQVRRPGDDRGVTMTLEQMQAEGIPVPVAPVRFIGQQPGLPAEMAPAIRARLESKGLASSEVERQLAELINPVDLYNATEDFAGIPFDSTVTAKTLLEKGYALPAKEAVASPAAGVAKNPDGTYTVKATAEAAPAVASTSEGAVMVVEQQRTEAAQQAATQAPEPRPENDNQPLPPRTTALTKEEIAGLRQLYSMDALPVPERERWEQVLDEAKRKGAHLTTDALVADLLATGRAQTAVEAAALRLRAVELQNRHEHYAAEIADASARGDEARARALQNADRNTIDELDRLTEADDRAGTAAARALAIRRMRLSRDDYSIVKLVQRATTAKKAALTSEERGRLEKVEADLLEQQRIVERQKAELVAQSLELAKAQAETFVAEGRARRRAAGAADAVQRRKEVKRQLMEMGVRVNDITSLVPMSYEYARLIAKLADTYIEEGVGSLVELTNKLKADLPDLSEQDIYMAVGRQTKKQAAKIEAEAKRRVKELRAQAALWAKINAALNDQRPDGSPVNRQQKNKILRETLAQLRRQANRTVFDDAALKRIDGKIAEVQRQIATGERDLREPGQTRPPNEALSQARDTLRDLRQELGALDTISELESQLGEIESANQPAKPGEAPKPKPTPAESNARRNALRERIAELRDQIDQAQVDPAAVNAERVARLQRLAADLEAQLEGGFREIPEPRRPGVPDDAATEAARRQIRELERLMRTEDAIADLQEQIRTGEFKVSAPERRILSNARLEQALIRQRQLRREADQLIDDLRKRTAFETIVETLLIPRTLLATADLSATFRQGILLSASRPVTATRALLASLRAAASENVSDATALAIERRRGWEIGERSGLYLAEVGSAINAREEHFLSRFAEKIPLYGRLVKASNRAMVTHLNMLRVAAFDGFVTAHPDATPEQLRAYARYVNAASGRGNVKWGAGTVKTLNAVFFAPRYAVSRFQALYSPFANFNDAPVRNAILKDFGAFLGTGATVLLLAQLAGADVTLDPSDSDFGKIVVDDTRIDIWGGLQQPARLILQGALLLPQKLEMVELERDIDLLDAGTRFLSYKLSPAITVPLTLAEGENMIGQEQGASETLARSVIPLSFQEMYDVWDNTGDAGRATAAGLASFFGIGIQEHD